MVRGLWILVLAGACGAEDGSESADARRIPPPPPVADAGDIDPPIDADEEPGPDADPGPTSGRLVLNEVDYDQVGTDFDEFVEVYNPCDTPVDLAEYALVLMNGNGAVEYGRVYLSGILAGQGFAVVGSATVPVAPGTLVVHFSAASNNLQNGAPDALALFHMPTGLLVDALSYQGSITAGAVTGLGTFDFVEGTPTSASDDDGGPLSLIRLPDGQDTDDAAMDWAASATPTPGAANLP